MNLFESFIMGCCKAKEANLRKWLKSSLTQYGFSIKEDDYVSERAKDDPSYKTVHNMLAIRGKNPKICLVAHTDVCRDHSSGRFKRKEGAVVADPCIREIEMEIGKEKQKRRIITDRENKVQVGGDDRLGVAINAWIGIHSKYDMGLLFTTDEEIGLRSARACNFPELAKFDLALQVDRGNHSDELVTKINGTQLCSYETTGRLLEIAFDIDMPRKPVLGMSTDVVTLKDRNIVKEAVNMTCGYHNSYSDDADEFIDIEEAIRTMKYVATIVKDYNVL